MQYSPDRDPLRMDLPKYPTYWLGSDSPPLLRIHRRLKSIAEPPPEREVSSSEGWVPNGSNSGMDFRFSRQENPGMFSSEGRSRRQRSQPVRKQFQRGVSSRNG
jgi:hypothetical protein